MLGVGLSKEQADHGRGPRAHVELFRSFRQVAGGVVAPFGEIAPQRGIGVLRVEFGGLLEIGYRVRVAAADNIIRDAPVEIGRGIVGVELDRFAEILDGGGIVAKDIGEASAGEISRSEIGVDRIASFMSVMARAKSPLLLYTSPREKKARA